MTGTVEVILGGIRNSGVYSSFLGTKGKRLMKPNIVILGLRMPEYEKLMVISAAKVAGISNIEELYINDSDQLDTRAITSV